MRLSHSVKLILISLVGFFSPKLGFSYALLSHEAIIDETWNESIKPLLLKKFPQSTEAQLKEAHAYVYGGSILPDIGYYPMGSLLFTHLAHYVRTGDFVTNLINESQNLNEYAFAIGMLCHYTADNIGHSEGTNRAVPVLFPKLKEKYGDTITYAEGRTEHLRVEFGFDVLQTARGNYDPEKYNNFIGFKISEPVLERAFLKTYGLELKSVFKSLPVAIESFRFVVKSLIPELTRDAWKVRKTEINKLNPLAEEESYIYKVDKKKYKKEYGKVSLMTPVVAALIAVTPKIGPLKKMKFRAPNEESEKLYNDSYRKICRKFMTYLNEIGNDKFRFENSDLDTGHKIHSGEYELVDKTYYKLLRKQQRKKFEHMNSALKSNLVAYYESTETQKIYSSHPHKWKKITKAIDDLRATHNS
jgi:hypothetical protein